MEKKLEKKKFLLLAGAAISLIIIMMIFLSWDKIVPKKTHKPVVKEDKQMEKPMVDKKELEKKLDEKGLVFGEPKYFENLANADELPFLADVKGNQILYKKGEDYLILYNTEDGSKRTIEKNVKTALLTDDGNIFFSRTLEGAGFAEGVYHYDIEREKNNGVIKTVFFTDNIRSFVYNKGLVYYTYKSVAEPTESYMETRGYVIPKYVMKYPSNMSNLAYRDTNETLTVQNGVFFYVDANRQSIVGFKPGEDVYEYKKITEPLKNPQKLNFIDNQNWFVVDKTVDIEILGHKIILSNGDVIEKEEGFQQVEWLNKDYLIYVVEGNLYLYDVKKKEETAVMESVFQIKVNNNKVYFVDALSRFGEMSYKEK